MPELLLSSAKSERGFCMKKRFRVEQIVAVLKQTELGVPVAEVIGKVGIGEQTFYRWKKQCVGRRLGVIRGSVGLLFSAIRSLPDRACPVRARRHARLAPRSAFSTRRSSLSVLANIERLPALAALPMRVMPPRTV